MNALRFYALLHFGTLSGFAQVARNDQLRGLKQLLL